MNTDSMLAPRASARPLAAPSRQTRIHRLRREIGWRELDAASHAFAARLARRLLKDDG